MKKQIISIRELHNQIKDYEALLDRYRNNDAQLRNEIKRLNQVIAEKDRLSFRNERAELIKGLGQLTEALSKAIVYTVGKEQL